MKVIEKNNDKIGIDVFKQCVDRPLTYYEKKSNTHKEATWIKEKTNNAFPNKNHCIVFSGACGSGKTTSCLSIYFSMKQRMYCGCYDMVLVCVPPSTLKSLGEKSPFRDLPEDQVYDSFNEVFLKEADEICEYNSKNDKDTLVFIDDGANQLKSNKKVIDAFSNLVMKHRHKRCTLLLCCQDLIQLPLPIRENLSCVAVFKQQNQKRSKLFWEEYMSDVVSYHEYLELCDQVLFKNKGDFLYINLQSNPKRYLRNLNELQFFNTSVNGSLQTSQECQKEEESGKNQECK